MRFSSFHPATTGVEGSAPSSIGTIPNVTGTPSISATTSITKDGIVKVYLAGSWSAVADASSYDIEINNSTISWVISSPVAYISNFELEVKPSSPLSYTIRVKAVNKNGVRSDNWSNTSNAIVAVGDLTPPAEVTSLSVIEGMTTIKFTWTDPTDVDFSHVKIYGGTSSTTKINILPQGKWVSPGGKFQYDHNKWGETIYFWVATVDTSGNESVGVASGPVTLPISGPGSLGWNSSNDGAGSGLDADLLDGYDSADFLRKSETPTITSTWSFVSNALVSASDYYGSSTWTQILSANSVSTQAALALRAKASSGNFATGSLHVVPVAEYRSGLVATYSADGSGAGYFAVNQFVPTSSTTLERLRVNVDGKLLIGAATPVGDERVNINGRLRVGSFQSYNVGNAATLYGAENTNTETSLQLHQAGVASVRLGSKANDANIYLTNDYNGNGLGNAATSITISSIGNVGIGTTTPSVKLDVVGGDNDGLQYRTSTRAVGLGMQSAEAAVYWGSGTRLNFASGGAIPMTILADGKVGIGTTAPVSKLGVVGGDLSIGDVSFSNNNNIIFYGKNGSSTVETNYIGFVNGYEPGQLAAKISFLRGASSQDGILSFNTRAQGGALGERIRILADGKVGVGTIAPTKTLHVYDATAVIGNPTIRLEGVQGGYGAGVEAGSRVSGGSYLALGKIVWDGEGPWDVNTSTQDSYFRIFNTYGGALLERLRITAYGDVGIGVTNPSARIDTLTTTETTGTNTLVARFNKNSTNGAGSSILRLTSDGVSSDFETNSASSGGSFRFSSNYGDTNIANLINATNGPYGNINFVTNSAIRMTIGAGTQAGYVGIGTASPSFVGLGGNSLPILVVNGSTASGGITKSDTRLGQSTALFDRNGWWGIRAGTDNSFNIDTYNGNNPLSPFTVFQDGTIRTAGGMKKYTVTTPNQGNSNSKYELMRISRDPLNWSPNSSYIVTIHNKYFSGGGRTVWHIAYGIDSSGTISCIDARGPAKFKLYFGAEVTINANVAYRPVFVDIVEYRDVSIEVEFNTNVVTSITDEAQVHFTGTMTTGTGALYSGDTHIVPDGGNLGIGTTNPQHRLTVTGGNLAVESGSAYLSSSYALHFNYGVDNNYYINKNGTTLLMNTGGNFAMMNGRLGIGTTAPDGTLTVFNSATFNARTSGINVHRPSSYGQYGSMSYDGDTTYFSSTYTGGGAGGYGAFVFQSYDSTSTPIERLRINRDTGNVGINMSSPSTKVHAAQSISRSTILDTLLLETTVSGGIGAAYYGGLRFAGNGYDWGAIRPIQTDPSVSWVNRLAFFTMNGNGGSLLERLSIDNAGNVGIGTTTPGQKLHVNGMTQTVALYNSAWNRSQTDYGYIDFGPANAGHGHIYTDRPTFYFNKEIFINGATVWNSGNDGASSGLDSDLLDGLQASAFMQLAEVQTASGRKTFSNAVGTTVGDIYANSYTNSAIEVFSGASNKPAYMSYHITGVVGVTWGLNTNGWMATNATGIQVNGNSVWHAGNDGSGSGLDADLLKGKTIAEAATADTIVSRNGGGRFSAIGIDFYGSSIGDLVNSAPWYGVGKSDITSFGGGGNVIQMAGYYGLRIRSANSTMDFYQNGRIITAVPTNKDFRVDGILNATRGIVDYSVDDNSSRPARILIPEGGARVGSAGSETGAIKIELPADRYVGNSMMTFTVCIYEYTTGRTRRILCGGYNYTYWVYTSAIQQTESGGNINVRFGRQSSRDCVWIGETNTVWNYPQVWIEDVNIGYAGFSNTWATGWAISLVTSFGTVENTHVAYAQWHGGNDGSGSGLDADLLDGYHANTTAESANTIPVRDSSGWLNQRVIRNINSGSDGMYIGYGNTNSGATRIYGGGSTTTNLTIQATSMTAPGEVYTPSGSYFRAVGTGGFYCETYNGGWNMTDGTWLRSIADKGILTGGAIQGATVTATSDLRLKENVTDLSHALDLVLAMQPRRFNWKKDGRSDIGAIAQELELIVPEVVYNGADDTKTVNYGALGIVAIAAIQELHEIVAALKTRIKVLEAK